MDKDGKIQWLSIRDEASKKLGGKMDGQDEVKFQAINGPSVMEI